MVALLTPEGPYSRGYWKLAALIASCPRWWSRICACANPTEAMERIHWPWAEDTDVDENDQPVELPRDARPRVIIDDSPTASFDKNGAGSVLIEMELTLTIEIPAYKKVGLWPANYWPEGFWPNGYWPEWELTKANQKTALTNAIGVLLREMLARSDQDPEANSPADPLETSHLCITRIRQVAAPNLFFPAETGGNYIGAAVFSLAWKGVM